MNPCSKQQLLVELAIEKVANAPCMQLALNFVPQKFSLGIGPTGPGRAA